MENWQNFRYIIGNYLTYLLIFGLSGIFIPPETIMDTFSVTVGFLGLMLIGFGVVYIYQAIVTSFQKKNSPVLTHPAETYKTLRETKVTK